MMQTFIFPIEAMGIQARADQSEICKEVYNDISNKKIFK